jgi:hypothetical protein
MWALGVLCVGIAHQIWPSYGGAFLDLMASISPGYHPGGFGPVIIATLYALVDGAIGGLVLGWVYNAAAGAAARTR